MLVTDKGTIYFQREDHVMMAKKVLKKLDEENIKVEKCMFFPVSLDSTWLAFSLIDAAVNVDLKSLIWSPDKNKPPMTGSIEYLVFLEDIIKKGKSKIDQAKKWFNILAKKAKISKKLKDKTEVSVCFATDSQQKFNKGKRRLISSILAKNADNMHVYPYGLKEDDNLKKMTFDEAMKEFEWEDEWRYLESHEVILDKLKTELWD